VKAFRLIILSSHAIYVKPLRQLNFMIAPTALSNWPTLIEHNATRYSQLLTEWRSRGSG
jgi:hypothetical protein